MDVPDIGGTAQTPAWQIFALIRDAERFDKREIARAVNMDHAGRDFGLALQAARDRLLEIDKVDFRPAGKPFEFSRANDYQKIDRSDNDRRNAVKKVCKAKKKLEAVDEKNLKPEDVAELRRKRDVAEKSEGFIRSAARSSSVEATIERFYKAQKKVKGGSK